MSDPFLPVKAVEIRPPADILLKLPLLLTVEQFSFYFAIKKTTIYDLLGSGELGSISVGRRRLIPLAEALRWVESCARHPDP